MNYNTTLCTLRYLFTLLIEMNLRNRMKVCVHASSTTMELYTYLLQAQRMLTKQMHGYAVG